MGGRSLARGEPFDIDKKLVYEAYKAVKSTKEAGKKYSLSIERQKKRKMSASKFIFLRFPKVPGVYFLIDGNPGWVIVVPVG